jgi:UDP-glucose 4-epimerase
MRILITGGAGFIGSHLVDRLIADGHDVTVIDNLSVGTIDNIAHHMDSDRFHFVCDSILNETTMEQLIRKSKQIYHLAAVVGVKYVVEDPLPRARCRAGGADLGFSGKGAVGGRAGADHCLI